MLERLGCNRIAQMSGNAEMRCPLPRFDPRCHQIDRIGGSMRRKCGEIIGLRQTFEISAGRKDDRHLAAIGHGEGRLRARPENMARSEEHTCEHQSLIRISYDVYCSTKKTISTQCKTKTNT